MKRAILIGFVAMAPVAGCGSDGTGTTGGGSNVQAGPVGGQSPPSNPQAPLPNSQAPLPNSQAPVANSQAPLPNPAAPPSAPGSSPGGVVLDCLALCGGLAPFCQPACNQVCDGIGAVTGPCAPLVHAFVACTEGITFSCNNRGRIDTTTVKPCRDELQSVVNCLNVDVSTRTPPSDNSSNNGPQPGQ